MASDSRFRLDGGDAPGTERLLSRALARGAVKSGAAQSTLTSPCVRDCCLNDEDMCLGCGRLLSEICGWYDANDPQREEILRQAKARLEARRAQRGMAPR